MAVPSSEEISTNIFRRYIEGMELSRDTDVGKETEVEFSVGRTTESSTEIKRRM